MSCKHAYLIHKIVVLCRKKIITSIHLSFSQLGRMVPPQRHCEASEPQNLRDDPKLVLNLDKNTLTSKIRVKMVILSAH